MAGQYRQDIHWPQYARFTPPHWRQIHGCMLQLGRLMELAQNECNALEGEARDEKVIEWVARLHHRLERIHPFEDGNGRTGRALATWMLLHYDLPPFDVTAETGEAYIDALGAADEQLTLEDLLHPDVWPHQTVALERLVDFFIEALLGETLAEEEGQP